MYKRIEDRVDAMMKTGLVEEIRDLVTCGIEKNPEAMQAIGCKEIIACLGGTYTLPEAVDLMKRNSRRYAKRQMTWFNADERVKWIDLAPDETAQSGAEKVLDVLEKKD